MTPSTLLHPLKLDVVGFQEDEHDYHFRVELPEPKCCQSCGTLYNLVKFGKDDQAYRDVPIHDKRSTIWVVLRRYKCNSCNSTFRHDLMDMDDRRISPDIRIRGDFDQASSNISVQGFSKHPEYDDWQPTVFQVADFGHDPKRALRGVDEWLEQQEKIMRIETRPVFIAEDGTEFDTEEGAISHEARISLRILLESSNIYWRDTSVNEVIDVLLENSEDISRLMKKAGGAA